MKTRKQRISKSIEELKEIINPIGFMIEGEYIVVANPCTIPIEMLEEVLKEKRKKGLVTSCFMIQIPLKFPKRK